MQGGIGDTVSHGTSPADVSTSHKKAGPEGPASFDGAVVTAQIVSA